MSELRVVGATIVADPDRVWRDAEIAYSPDTGRVTYLGPVRGPGRASSTAQARVPAAMVATAAVRAGCGR